MTLAEWDNDASLMDTDDLKRRLEAIKTLQDWPAFDREYKWTGYRTNGQILQFELNKRER